MADKVVILKVGGSILSKSEEVLFDFNAATEIKNALLPLVENGYQFILCCGGGYTARRYQEISKQSGMSEHEIHWVGTEACNMNAVLMRGALGDFVEDKPILAMSVIEKTPIKFSKPFLTVGAAEPGHSSDTDSVEIALRSSSKLIISLKNVDGVYSADPKKDPSAKKYDKLSWPEYFDIIKVKEHEPGGHYPVDPIASKKAQENNIRFLILDGEDLLNVVKAIKGEDFVGTTIG